MDPLTSQLANKHEIDLYNLCADLIDADTDNAGVVTGFLKTCIIGAADLELLDESDKQEHQRLLREFVNILELAIPDTLERSRNLDDSVKAILQNAARIDNDSDAGDADNDVIWLQSALKLAAHCSSIKLHAIESALLKCDLMISSYELMRCSSGGLIAQLREWARLCCNFAPTSVSADSTGPSEVFSVKFLDAVKSFAAKPFPIEDAFTSFAEAVCDGMVSRDAKEEIDQVL